MVKSEDNNTCINILNKIIPKLILLCIEWKPTVKSGL